MALTADADLAVRQWLNYRESLKSAQSMQQGGFVVPNTKMGDFVGEINSASRRLISAFGITDPTFIEAMGELLINAAKNIEHQSTDKTFMW